MIYLLALSLMVLVITSILAIIKSDMRARTMAWIIPLLVFNVGFSWHTIDALRGQPTQAAIQGEHELIFVHISRPNILLLVQSGAAVPVYHALPYSDRLARDLTAAQKSIQGGQKTMMRPRDRSGSGDPIPDHHYEFYPFDHEHVMPKQPSR